MGILIKAPTRRREPALTQVDAQGSTSDTRGSLHIREVVRITGLRREQLYMWQRRYGFPMPLRDAFGDRVYPPDQAASLRRMARRRGRSAGGLGAAVDAWPCGRRASAAGVRNRDCREAALPA